MPARKHNGLLPIPVIVALLRIMRQKPAGEDDEDVLFDYFDTVGSEQVIVKATIILLGTSDGDLDSVHTAHARSRRQALDALLVDMLRTHKRKRDEARDEPGTGSGWLRRVA